jgi:HAD superfamily hydrolase (TIGR01549 family)
MIKAVLFDMDGVLVDTFNIWAQLINKTAEHFGHPPIEASRFRSVYGQSTEEDVKAFFPGQSVKQIDSYYADHFLEFIDQIETIPEAKVVFSTLDSHGIGVAVITNTASLLARKILAVSELSPKIVVGGDDVINGKPSPEMVFSACDQLTISASEALVVGDSQYDMEAALTAGARFVGIGSVQSDVKIRNLRELLTIIELPPN